MLQAFHIPRVHPLNSASGLACHTCKVFINSQQLATRLHAQDGSQILAWDNLDPLSKEYFARSLRYLIHFVHYGQEPHSLAYVLGDALALEHRGDLNILFNVHTKGMNVVEVCARLEELYADIPVIIDFFVTLCNVFDLYNYLGDIVRPRYSKAKVIQQC